MIIGKHLYNYEKNYVTQANELGSMIGIKPDNYKDYLGKLAFRAEDKEYIVYEINDYVEVIEMESEKYTEDLLLAVVNIAKLLDKELIILEKHRDFMQKLIDGKYHAGCGRI